MQTAPRDLTSPRERPTYQIDQRTIEVRSPYDLTLEEFERLGPLFMRMGVMTLIPERTKGQHAELREVMRDLVTLATGEADVYALVGELRAMVICNDFMTLCSPIIATLRGNRANPAERNLPRDNSSPVSSGSTADRRTPGPARPRSAPSKRSRKR